MKPNTQPVRVQWCGANLNRNSDETVAQFVLGKCEGALNPEVTDHRDRPELEAGPGHIMMVVDGFGEADEVRSAAQDVTSRVLQEYVSSIPWDSEPDELILRRHMKSSLRAAQDDCIVSPELHESQDPISLTLNVAYCRWPNLHLAHVGSGRAYLWRNGKLRQLTTDHTVNRVLRDHGQTPVTTPAEPTVWNVLGGESACLEPEVLRLDLLADDWLVLLSSQAVRGFGPNALRLLLRQGRSPREFLANMTQSGRVQDGSATVAHFVTDEPRVTATMAPRPKLARGAKPDRPKTRTA